MVQIMYHKQVVKLHLVLGEMFLLQYFCWTRNKSDLGQIWHQQSVDKNWRCSKNTSKLCSMCKTQKMELQSVAVMRSEFLDDVGLEMFNWRINYRLTTAYLLLRVNVDKIMHARWDFDASSARTRRVSALDKHQNWSASALFCLNSRAQSKYAVVNLIHTRRKQTFLSFIMW